MGSSFLPTNKAVSERWSITSALQGSSVLEDLLNDGWEPFGVVALDWPGSRSFYIYLKKVLV